jgi:hypothetical protein
LLSGKGGDIATAEQSHATAVRNAMDAIRTLMSESGQEMTSATSQAVHDTLLALPGSVAPGRLTKPLKLAGFEALAGLVPASAPVLRGLSPKPPTPPPAKQAPEEKKRAEAARRRERTELQASLREARQDATKAATALTAARRELDRAKDERDRLQNQLQFAIKKIDDATTSLREHEQGLARAEQERERLERKLAALDDTE